MNVLSLFDGMSCGQIALERAGIKVDNYFASEIKKHAIDVTKHNYPNTIHLGDVTKWREWDLPKIDMVIGGSPCQDFSRANAVRDGLEGEKSSLAYVLSDIIDELKPKYWLVENVIMGAENVTAMSELFHSRPIRINSSLVSAQLRDRLYWTNIGEQDFDLFGTPTPAMPLPKDKGIMLSDIIESGYTERKKSRALLESDSRVLKDQKRMAWRHIEKGFNTVVFKSKEAYEKAKKSIIEEVVFTPGDLRYFTRAEREALQTVPQGYTDCVSINDAACLLGDGWTVDVIAHIFKGIGAK